MMRFFAARFSSAPRFSAAEILGAWQFVTAVIDHIVAGDSGRDIRLQFVDLHLHENCGGDQESLQYVGGNHNPQGNQAKRGLTRKPRF
jgi:hypothetical protein